MDLAAQRISSLAQRILPDRPHHLSISADRRYPVPPDFLEHHSNLQYSTFLSDTDRGILLTRPYYEIWEEPDSSAHSPANGPSANAAPPAAKKSVTKMSFKDYQNSKKKPSPSPPDAPAKLGGGKSNHADDSRLAPRASARPGDPGVRKSTDSAARDDLSKSRVRNTSRERPHRNGRTPSPDVGRRSPYPQDSSRPVKKARIEHDRRDVSPAPKHESVSSKHPANSADRHAHKEARSGSQQPANGRSTSANYKNGDTSTASPHKPAVNGSKTSNGGGSTGARRTESSGKPSFIPSLLSPLRLSSLDDDRDSRNRTPATRPTDTSASSKTQGRSEKADGVHPPRKNRALPQLPPLLSPTLPAIVEEELARELALTKKGGNSNAPAKASTQPEPPAEEEKPPSLVVKLKYKKKNGLRVQRLLALQPSSVKEALKKERSISADIASPPARKRPRPVEGAVDGSVASKRPRTSMDIVSVPRPAAPSTPLKPVAMSRAASSNSQAQTPGDGTGLTPGASDRPPTSHDVDASKGSSFRALYLKNQEYAKLGSVLKHKRDDIIPPAKGTNKVEAFNQAPTSDRKRVAVLSLEMVMSFMVSFEAHNQGRVQERKPGDWTIWETLLPHFYELRAFTRGFRPLDALRLQLHAIVQEELVRVYYNHDLAAIGPRLLREGNKLQGMWVEAHSSVTSIPESSMRADLGPWTRPSGAAASALLVLRRWAERESVEWRPLLALPTANGL